MSEVEEHDFTHYETTAVDPGLGFTLIVIILCILINLSLPLWLRLGDRLSPPKVAQEDALNNNENENNNNNDNEAASSSVSAPASVHSKNLTRQNYPHHHHHYRGGATAGSGTNGPAASVVSSSVASSTKFTDAASAILEARPRRTGAPQRRGRRKKRIKADGGGRDVRIAAELATTEQVLQRYINNNNNNNNNTADNRSDAAPSILSKLDVDAISVQDAVDAKDTGVVPLSKMDARHSQPLSRWERFLDIADWDREMSKFVRLAIPFAVQGVSIELFAIVNVAIVGHFVGVMEANAFVVVNILLEFTTTLNRGFAECLGVLVPHADGAGNDLMVGRYMQLSIFFYSLMTIPGVVIWTFLTEEAVLWFGFDETTAAIGQEYAYTVLIYLFVHGIFQCFTEFLNTLDHEHYATVFTVGFGAAESIAITIVAVLGVKDLVVIGLVQVAVGVVAVLLNLAIIMHKGWLENYWEGMFQTNGLKDRRAVHTVFITAIPLGVAWLLTFGEWEVMTLFARNMGPAEVAAWGIIGYVWSAFETITDAFGDASEVRVGFRMGAGQVDIAKRVGKKSVYFGVVVAVFETGLVFIVAEYLPTWLTPDPTLQKMLFDMLPLIGFGQILMVAGMEAWAVIGAQGRVRLATVVEFVISWFIAVPLSAICVYGFNLNLESMVAALTIAYTVGANVYLYILFTSDWESLSAIVVARNAAEGVMYDEFDWDDLPEDIQQAATILGYTKELWENDEEPETAEKAWDQLTEEEKKAAVLLGFNKKKWDTDSHSATDESSDDKYDKYDWSDLPSEVKKAAKILGYTQSLWNKDDEPPLGSKDWVELTVEQQEAARVIGYDQRRWDGEPDAPPSYDDVDWKDLPKKVKAAAECLQYTKHIWDQDGKSPLDDMNWRQLTPEQQKAASVLGYNEKKWDEDDDSDDDDFADAEESFESFDWNELPTHAKDAARCLGYQRSTWRTSGNNAVRTKAWRDLTASEKKAAHTLGFSEQKWDGDVSLRSCDVESGKLPLETNQDESDSKPSAVKLQQDIASLFGFTLAKRGEPSDEPCEYDEDGYWRDLPARAREAAEVLGFNQQLWDEDGEPPSSDKDWDELSPEEMRAARVLGYSEQKWNDDGSDSS